MVRAAARLFAREGYHPASLDKVADAAGYTKGAVYSQFGSKAELFLAVFDSWLDVRTAELRALDDPAKAGAQWFARMGKDRDLLIVFLEFRLHAARDRSLNRAYAERNRRLLEAARDALDPREDGSLEYAATLVALGNGYLLELITDPTLLSEHRLSEAAASIARSHHRSSVQPV